MLKNKITILILAFSIISFTSVNAQNSNDDRLGIVDTHDNYKIFFFSTPVDEYETLGYLKEAKLVWTGKPKEMFKLMLKKTRKQYPNADALIVEELHMNRVRAIKFID